MLWERNFARSLAERSKGLAPSRVTLPWVGVSSVPRMLRSVDLPEPLGPRMARESPGLRARLMPRRTTSGVVGVGYSLCRSLTWRLVAIAEVPFGPLGAFPHPPTSGVLKHTLLSCVPWEQFLVELEHLRSHVIIGKLRKDGGLALAAELGA